MPPLAPPTPNHSGTIAPAVFAKAMQALLSCPAVTKAMVDAYKAEIGADWAIVQALLGADVPHELNRMDDRGKAACLGILVRKQAEAYRKAQAAQAPPRSSGEDLLAAVGIHKPVAAPQRPSEAPRQPEAMAGPVAPPRVPQQPAEPSHDSVPAIIRRVAGTRAGEVYAGPDLIRRVVALNFGPERTELAFKAAAQRPPAKFSSLGWAALTRLERLAGLRPPLDE